MAEHKQPRPAFEINEEIIIRGYAFRIASFTGDGMVLRVLGKLKKQKPSARANVHKKQQRKKTP